MSRPRNNLDELQRKHAPVAASSGPSKPATPQRSAGKGKFKPAKSLPISTPSNVAVRKLASFSTPGWGKTKPSPLNHSSAADNSISYVNVSSTESTPVNTSTSSVPAKRLSSGFSGDLLPSSPPKRPKIDHQPNKENIFLGSNGKGKTRAREPSRSPASLPIPIPSPKFPAKPPVATTNSLQAVFETLVHDVDLREKSEKQLRGVCDTVQDLMEHCDKLIGAARTDPSEPKDIVLLNALSDWCEKRLAAGRTELKAIQRGERPPVTRTPSSDPISPLGSSTALDDEDLYWATDPPVPSSRNVLPQTTIPMNAATNTDADDQYWNAFHDTTIDLTDEQDTPPIPTPATPPATQPRSISHVVPPDAAPASDSRFEQRVYYPKLVEALKKTFKLQSFRPKQLDAICAAMDGKDVFVLFPTGSGKSLTFQIPAVCQRGVTVVVSPLMSLMRDQVTGLRKRSVNVAQLSSDMTEPERQQVRQQLWSGDKPNLLYVTPEQLQLSDYMRSTLVMLYENNQLIRFVIDEAHCISDWGRRFRDSYTQLTELRKLYPKVPISALTATANAEVEHDIVARLNIAGCERLRMSFNRKNLDYEVRPKKSAKACLEEIATYIQANHARETGIIYCNSRTNCEDVAKALRDKYRLRAKHYHAHLDPRDREKVQEEWYRGDVLIIVATIAFGMGIDKSNVRFVIHHTLPATLSNYYQETGRAGRDGNLAKCILYYTYSDAATRVDMIRKEEKSDEEKRWMEEDFWNVVRYCTNNVRCRRQQVLNFFGESFNSALCGELCNNCRDKSPISNEDHTTNALKATRLFESLSQPKMHLTKGQLVAAIRGSKTKVMVEKGFCNHPQYGICKDLALPVAERLVDEMLLAGILTTVQVQTGEYSQSYLKLGHKATPLKNGQFNLQIVFRKAVPRQRKARGKAAQELVDAGTNSASSSAAGPSTARSRKVKVVAIPEDSGAKMSLFRDDLEDDVVEDDIEEVMSPLRRMGSRAMPSASHSLATDLMSDIEEVNSPQLLKVTMIEKEDIQDFDTEDIHVLCKNELLELREKMRKTAPVVADFVTDETIEFLALMLPNDLKALEDQLSEVGVAIQHLGGYEKQILNLCTQYHMQR